MQGCSSQHFWLLNPQIISTDDPFGLSLEMSCEQFSQKWIFPCPCCFAGRYFLDMKRLKNPVFHRK